MNIWEESWKAEQIGLLVSSDRLWQLIVGDCASSPLSFVATTSLALSDYLFPGEGERRWERGKEGERERKRLVSTVMADERKRDRFCLVAHLSSLSSFPLFTLLFLKSTPAPPPSLSVSHSLKTYICSSFRFSPLFCSSSFPRHSFFLFQSPLHLLAPLSVLVSRFFLHNTNITPKQ